jgi:signal transduction histidine kinase
LLKFFHKRNILVNQKAEEGVVKMNEERILVVDDEEPVRNVVSEIVDLMGCKAVTVGSAKGALEILEKEPFGIMITDVKMPEMDGFELMKAVLSRFPHIYVVCMTGHGDSCTYTDVLSMGVKDYITKPFTADEMKAKLSRVIREKHLIEDLTQKSVELGIANAELKQLSQMKSTFISSVSHELRTPLTVIKEFISLMLEGHVGALNENQKEYLGIAHKNILRLTNLIETLLDFSRIESGKGLKLRFESVPLGEVVEDAVMTLSQQMHDKGITFVNRLDAEIPRLLIDRNRMIEVFINLIGNGIKFTPPGGKIIIDSKGLTEKRDSLKVVVTDTGIGISEEDLPKIFDRFYQGKRVQEGIVKGTGLGLAITKEIIEGHQGTIEAESKLASGTSFHFPLPLFGVESILNLLLKPTVEEAERDSISFSLIQIEFWDRRAKRETTLTGEAWEKVLNAMKKMIRAVDTVLAFQHKRIYMFSYNDKGMAKEIGERIKAKLTQGADIAKGTGVEFKTYSFPKDARTQEDFLKGCRLFLKED